MLTHGIKQVTLLVITMNDAGSRESASRIWTGPKACEVVYCNNEWDLHIWGFLHVEYDASLGCATRVTCKCWDVFVIDCFWICTCRWLFLILHLSLFLTLYLFLTVFGFVPVIDCFWFAWMCCAQNCDPAFDLCFELVKVFVLRWPYVVDRMLNFKN